MQTPEPPLFYFQISGPKGSTANAPMANSTGLSLWANVYTLAAQRSSAEMQGNDTVLNGWF